MIALLWLACTPTDPADARSDRQGTDDPIEDTATESPPLARLDDAAWLRRVSFDLRGVPPTTAELDESDYRSDFEFHRRRNFSADERRWSDLLSLAYTERFVKM